MRRTPHLLPAVALAIAACDGELPRGGAGAAPTTVVIAELGDAAALLPVVEQTSLDAEINDLLYLSLNAPRWRDGELVHTLEEPALASALEFGPDSSTLTYTLREDAVWSDGAALTARDVVFTYELARDTLVASPHSNVWANLDSVAARDPRTVTFYFKRQHPDMLFQTSKIGVIPRHIYGDADRRTLRSHPRLANPGNGNLVASGPYTVGRWEKGSALVLVPNPRAFTGRPAIERVVFRVIPEQATRLVEFVGGRVDVAPIPFNRAREIDAHPELRVERVQARHYDFVAWNPGRFEPFADSEVRRALSLAIDRAGLLSSLDMREFATAAAGPYPPIFRRTHDPEVRPDPYLPDSARAILGRRGWRDSDGDGILDKEGRAFRFTLVTIAGHARRESVAQIVQAHLRKLGVAAEVRLVEANTFWSDFYGRRYQAALAGWQVGLSPDLGALFESAGRMNVVGYDNPRVTALIESARAQRTRDAAARYWQAVGRLVAQDRPYAFLYYYDVLVGVNERVQNTRIDTYGVYQNLYAWRVAPRPQPVAEVATVASGEPPR